MKAIILLSGGLDSTVMMAIALKNDRECHAISFDYGQRHKCELEHAKAVAAHYNVPHKIITIDPSCFDNSSLVSSMTVPKNRKLTEMNNGKIPNTYVPARNTLFLAYALGQAEIQCAQEIYAGMNALDSLPYPDCRPEFVNAFQGLMNVATKQAVEGNPPKLVTPLLHWNKTEIIQQGMLLKAPIHLTWSCYDPSPKKDPCGSCDACILRNDALRRAIGCC